MSFSKKRAALILALAAVILLPSCKIKHKMDADPGLVKAFQEADALIATSRDATEANQVYGDQVAGTIDNLMKEFIRVNSRYSNAQQRNDLHQLVVELGEVYAEASSLGYNPNQGRLGSLHSHWIALRPRLRQFVGPAADPLPAEK